MTKIILPEPYDKWYSLREAAEAMGYKHAQYVRQLVRPDPETGESKFGEYGTDFVKVDMGAYEQWLLNPDSCVAYKERAAASGGFGAQTGTRRYLLRIDTDKVTAEQIAAVLEDNFGASGDPNTTECAYEFSKAWSGKSKAGKSKAKGEPEEHFTARILTSLTEADEDEDEDDALS